MNAYRTEQPVTIHHHHTDHFHRFDLDGSFLFWVLVFVVIVKALKD